MPESYVALDHSLTIGALTLTLSPTLTALSAISNYLLALAAAANAGIAGAVGVRLNYSALRGLLPGGSTQQATCEATQLTPNMQPMSVRRQVPFAQP